MPRKPATDFLKGAASLPEAAWNLWDEIVSPESTQKFEGYLQDPARWIHVEEGSDLWSRQRQIIEAVRDMRRVAVPSCYASGKSYIAARIVAHWIACHPMGEAFAVTTATTDAQVRAILWRELRRAHKSARLMGRLTEREWKINDELVAMGRKPADYNPEAFQGLHARHILVVIDEACHDEVTEVMTEDGWRKFADLTGRERLLTMDPDSERAEYVRPIRIVRKPYRGPMVEYQSNNADFCVTPEHRMRYRPKLGHPTPDRRWGEWRLAPITELLRYNASYQLPRRVHWVFPDSDTYKLPALRTDRKDFPARELPMDDWCTFLGWYCSEGSLRRARGRFTGITISQHNIATLDEIAAITERLGFNPRRCLNGVIVNSMQLAAYLAYWGHGALKKRVPDCVRRASARQISLFIDSYVRGDGYHKGNGRDIIYTSSPQMADDLQECILKTGVGSVIRPRILKGCIADFGDHTATPTADGFVVSRTARSSMLKFRRDNARLVDYNGTVYCATLPRYHLLLTRRHGYALWSGNSGVPEVIFRAAAGLASNEHSRILAIGNPNDPQSYFASVCQPDSGWEVIPISAFDTPNFTGEVVPSVVGDSLISKNYVQELREEVGEDSPVYITKVLGKFPENREDGVIPLSWVRACQNLDEHYTADQLLPVELGMDVGAGGDETNIRVRYGLKAGRAWKRKTPDWQDAVALALEAIEETHAIAIKIDRIGVGWGVEGRLKELYDEGKHLARVIGVNVGQSPANKEKYPRLRDQLWWEVGRELSRGFAWDLSVLKDKEVAQLIAPTYFRDTANRIHIEAKVETRKRLKRSPDDADALLLAFYEPTQSAGVWFLDSAWGEGVSAVGEEMGIGLGGLG